MRKHLLSLFLCCSMGAAAEPVVTVSKSGTLDVANSQGLAAFFSGRVGNDVVVAGGANFPDAPITEGGAKHFYDEIRTLQGDGTWKVTGRLPYAAASGASVTTSEGVVCLGGMDSTMTHSEAFIITKDGIVDLPAMPIPLREHAAAVYKSKVLVVGGSNDDGNNTNIYCLDLGNKKAGWEVLATLPEACTGMVQPVAVVQTDATTTRLYIFGGYNMATKPDVVVNRGFALDMLTLTWSETEPLPEGFTSIGGVGVASGYSHILLFGGVSPKVFADRVNDPNPTMEYFQHETSWYNFNQDIYVYHTITDSWFNMKGSDLLARAGAGIVPLSGNEWLYINGELKPGVRSTDVANVKVTQPRSFGWLNWTVLILYLLAMVLLGYIFMKRESGAEDFFKGGGRIPWWAAGISIYATMLSALTYMSLPAKSFATNWTYYPMLITILIVSFPVIKYYLPYFRRLSITSAYEYLEMRFNAVTRLLASGLFIVFMVARMALVLYLPSLALTAVTGINIQLCIVLMGIVTIMYCTMGGVEAVVWGDVIQGFILVGGAFFLAGWLIFNTDGGPAGYFQIAAEHDKFRLFEWSLDYRSVTFWVAIIGGLANNLISYTSDQTVIQRYLTTKDEKSAANSILMNGIMSVCVSIVFYIIGAGLYTFFKTHPADLDVTMAQGDAILPYFMMAKMPQGVAGLLIAAIFAATMSTISSNINSVSTAFSVDFWKRFRPQTSDRSMLRVARTSCIVSGVIGVGVALLMASWEILSLIDYFNTILGLLTGGLGGLFLMGIFMPRIGGKAALLGFTAGTVFVFWMSFCTDANLFLYGAAGIVVSVIVAFAASLVLNEERKVIKLKEE